MTNGKIFFFLFQASLKQADKLLDDQTGSYYSERERKRERSNGTENINKEETLF